MTPVPRSLLAVRLLAVLAAVVSLAAAAAPPSIQDLFRKPQFTQGTLSPSGRHLAVIAPVGERLGVAVIDLETRNVSRMEAPGGLDVLQVAWQTDERLLGFLGDRQRAAGEPARQGGIVAINRDGSDARVIAGPGGRGFERPGTVQVVRVLTGTNEILVTARDRSIDSADLYRYDTSTGHKELLSVEAPGEALHWVVDFDQVPRAVVTADLRSDTSAFYVRRSATAPWVKVREAKYGRLTVQPMQFDPDGKLLYVAARMEGDDRLSIYEFDMETLRFGKAIVRHPERDVGLENAYFRADYRARKLLGLVYTSNRPSVAWFDADHARVQAAVDKAFPDAFNQVQRPSAGSTRWLVTTSSDRNPGEAYLLDASTMKLDRLYASEPWIDPKVMAPSRWVTYKARDGLPIPALLTEPLARGDRKVPLIVDIHGGPNVQADAWGYNPYVQFFASRGYAVLQPQFRGTQGFGWKLESSGYRKWGDEMQDDLEDGMRWAAQEGIVDPDRVCLFGGSYGGYAALWGSIKQAKSIRCAISLVGVTSIEYLFDNAQTDLSRLADRTSLLVEQIGDPKTERARFRRVSPLYNADKVGVPLLIAWGGSDLRVPIVHGTDFKSALEKNGKTFEYVEYPEEGHGFNKDENLVDFFRRVEAFTAKYLGPGAR
jgi:dipeptidyl aminopeptidase/acylaminoacyl peptidase